VHGSGSYGSGDTSSSDIGSPDSISGNFLTYCLGFSPSMLTAKDGTLLDIFIFLLFLKT